MNIMYKRITLTPDEMIDLDDGQNWYHPGDECVLGGYIDGYGNLDLVVNNRVYDNWIRFHELPETIRYRLENAD